MYVEKTDGCHPAGAGCSKGDTGECGAAPQAFGHFSFADDQGHHARILNNPKFVNCQSCEHSNLSCQVNPFTSTWSFDVSQTPQQGVWFDIWIAVYWYCTKTYSAST
ncbi:23356_t:CDS:2 [Gigaspora rosea]|nr:23356_t:CDS:2 [Gigaspora rosea]